MNEIGLRLFQQLKSFDPEVCRDDYFHEEDRSWDIDGIESDLRLAQERNAANSTPNAATSSVVADTLHHVTPSEAKQSNTISTSTPMEMNSNPNATDTDKQASHQLPIITSHDSQTEHSSHSLSNHQQSQHPQDSHHLSIQQAQVSESNVAEMPSPNGSPSIDLDETNHDHNMTSQATLPSSNQHSVHMNNDQVSSAPITRSKSKSKSPAKSKSPSNSGSSSPRKTRANRPNRSKSRSNSPTKKAANKKRKSVSMEVDSTANPNKPVTGNQPPHKKQRRTYVPYAPPHAQWNEAALKKLTTLKRSVKNSDWFWEPVDEQKHFAPNYYLVCQMPSDFGTICSKLEKNEYEDLDTFLRQAELVFINARMYNNTTHAVHLASMAFEMKFKEAMTGIIKQYHEQFGSVRTWECWENAKRCYKPFAVPEH